MKKMVICISPMILLLLVPTLLDGQVMSGGNFVIEQSSTAPGVDATSGQFVITSTAGQSAAGNVLRGSSFGITSGFWNYVLNSTPVELGGQVTTISRVGIQNVVVTLTEEDGASHITFTGSFGYYRFPNIRTGQTVTISVQARHYLFAQPSQVVNVSSEMENLNFLAQ